MSIGDAAKRLEVSVGTLRRWDESGKLRAVRKSPGGDRFYREHDLDLFPNDVFQSALEWASADPQNIPEIPTRTYSENSGVFQAKLGKFQTAIKDIPGIEELFPLVVSISGEIGGNSFDHNLGQWPDKQGIFFAYDVDNREVVLADRGVGILATLKKALPNLINDQDALSEAFTNFISGRTNQSRGNGLKYVKEVVQKSLISLRFQSGNAELEIKRDSSDLNIKPAVQHLRGCLAYIKY